MKETELRLITATLRRIQMNESQQRAAIKQLELKLSRQEQAVDATKAMLELLRGATIDKQNPKR